MVGVSHLHDAQFSSNIVAASLHHQVHHTVGEVVFHAVFAELLVVLARHFANEEGG